MSPAFTFLCIIIASTFLGYVFSRIVIVFHSLLIAPIKRKKYLKLKEYKSVYAERVSGMPLPNPDDGFALTYKYTVDEKTYFKTIQSNYNDTFATLYYINNPELIVTDINDLYYIQDKKVITKIEIICTIIFFIALLLLWTLLK